MTNSFGFDFFYSRVLLASEILLTGWKDVGKVGKLGKVEKIGKKEN